MNNHLTPFHQNPRALRLQGWRNRKLRSTEKFYSSLPGVGVRGRGQNILMGVCGQVFGTVPLATEFEEQNYTLTCEKWLKIILSKMGNIIKITTFQAFVWNCLNVAKILLCGLEKESNWTNSQIPQCICSIFHNAPLRTKCAHFHFEWCIVGYGTDALWDLWNWPVR